MSELRAEAINLIGKIPEENMFDFLLMIKNFLQDKDPFWSYENQKHLRESIREMEEGKVVTFSDEEWEKFVDAQDI